MNYVRKLAKRVLASKPRTASDSRRALKRVLEEEGYTDSDPLTLAQLRVDVANAAREILDQEDEREKAS